MGLKSKGRSLVTPWTNETRNGGGCRPSMRGNPRFGLFSNFHNVVAPRGESFSRSDPGFDETILWIAWRQC